MKTKILFILFAFFALTSCSSGQQAERKVVSSLDDLESEIVVTLSGSVQDLLVTKSCPRSEILRCDNHTDVYTMVNSGKACASVTSSVDWQLACKNYPDIIQVGEGLQPLPVGVAFNKNDVELRQKFNEFLKGYLKNNDVREKIEQWSDLEHLPQMPDPSCVTDSKGTFRFAVAAISPPFNFIANGQVVGMEAEMLAEFAISQGMTWSFVDVTFVGLLPYLQSGKADAGAAVMCITPERSQSVDFSNPWLEEASVLIINKAYAPEEYLTGVQDETTSFWESTKDSLSKTLVKEDRYKMLLKGLKVTTYISLLSAIFGTLLGILLCYSVKRRNKLVSGVSAAFIEIMRCMPQVVFLMIMFYVVFGKSDIDGMWVAVVSFSLCFGAYTSVIFRSAVESIDKGQTEAALSMGFGRIKAFWNVVLPQTVQRALPVFKNEFISLVKATSIVGYIAVFDLTKAGDIIRSRTYEAFFPLIVVAIIYFIVIWTLTAMLKYVETETQPKRKKFFK